MKKLLSSIIVLLMMVQLVACGASENVDTEISSTEVKENVVQNDASESQEVDCYAKYEGLEFTTTINTGTFSLPEGQTLEDNVWVNWFNETTGMVTKVEWSASGDAYEQKMNAAIASGDIPDMMEVNYAQYLQLVKSDMLADLSDAIDTYMSPTLRSYYSYGDDAALNELTVDGKIYGIPAVSGTGDGSPMFWIRKDWLKKLNLQEPTCFEDVSTIAKAFMENDPDGNGIQDTYGLPLRAYYEAGYGGNACLGDFFLNVGGSAPGQWRIQEDGQVIYGSLMEGAKEALSMLNQWYESGIIPEDFATWSEEDYAQVLSSGKAGIGLGPWWAGYSYPSDTMHMDENAEWGVYALTREEGGSYLSAASSPISGNILVVKKDFEAPEAFICALNNCIESTNPGDLEVSYNYSPVHMPQPPYWMQAQGNASRMVASGEISSTEELYAFYETMSIKPGLQPELEHYQKLVEGADTRTTDLDIYVDYLCNWEGKLELFDGTNVKFLQTQFGGTTSAMNMYKNFLDTFEVEAYTNMIMGNTNGMSISEYFDAFVVDYLKQGGEEITKEVQAEIDLR